MAPTAGAASSKRKTKIPFPGTRGESFTSFYTRKKWKSLLQESTLEVCGRAIGPYGGAVLGNALRSNTYVVRLDLAHNGLRDEGAVAVAQMLRTNATVKHVNLAYNGITDAGGIALASAFIPNVSPSGKPGQWNRTLFTLILMGNELGDDTLLAMSNAAACNRDLTRIDLSWNHVGQQGTKCLLRAFQRNPLCVYQLAANNLGDAGVEHFCEAMRRYGGKSQTTLNLYRNEVSHRGAGALGQLLGNTSMVHEASLASNTIGFKGMLALRTQLMDGEAECSLHALNLSDNWIGDEGAAEVAALIAADIPSLERLNIAENRMTDDGTRLIFEALLSNTHLQVLDCAGNRMGPKAVAVAVRVVRETKSLRMMNLTGCVETVDHRRMLGMAMSETEGVHVELGNVVETNDGEDGGLASKMNEYLQVLADQEAQRLRDNPPKKKGKKGKKSVSA